MIGYLTIQTLTDLATSPAALCFYTWLVNSIATHYAARITSGSLLSKVAHFVVGIAGQLDKEGTK